jgi:hypothetical protein
MRRVGSALPAEEARVTVRDSALGGDGSGAREPRRVGEVSWARTAPGPTEWRDRAGTDQ